MEWKKPGSCRYRPPLFRWWCVELSKWTTNENGVAGEIETDWECSVKITAAFPAQNEKGFVKSLAVLNPGQNKF